MCTVDNCDVGHTFPSIYGLRMHFHATHIREEEKYFPCEHCGEKFSFKTERNKHVRTVHIKEHVCDICSRGFGSREKRDCHRRTHTGEKPFACHTCDYRAAKKFNLDMHLQAKHGDFGSNKNFLCAICNKQFVTMGRVRRHMALVHTDGKIGNNARSRRHRPVPLPPHLQEQLIQHQQEQEEQVLVETVKDDLDGHQVHVVTTAEVDEEEEEQHQEKQTVITVTPIHLTATESDS